ncbi:MAG: hypothetical protein JOZ27_05405 [Caulobacteraceae bacterium]|nr:hypothetical protein [Caulobacteraceae bacterium]
MTLDRNLKTLILAGASLALVGATATSSFADTRWQARHPRREEVNNRLANQNRRIRQEVKEGEMSHRQAAALHQDDRQIRREERLMAAQDGGHITKVDQRALNQQLNGASREIGK